MDEREITKLGEEAFQVYKKIKTEEKKLGVIKDKIIEKSQGKNASYKIHLKKATIRVTKTRTDFSFKLNKLFNYKNRNYIFTGCQIINKNLFSNYKNTSFSIFKIWNELIKDQKLYGFESLNEFIHITNLEIYNKLIKN